MAPYVIHRGQAVDVTPEDALDQFGADDVFLKGANAVDPAGNAGVLMADQKGGTIGGALARWRHAAPTWWCR